MTPYNQIFQLHKDGMNNSQITSQLGNVTRKTVITALKLAEQNNFTYPPQEPLTDTEIHRILHPKQGRTERMPDFDSVWFQLSLPGQSIAKIWAQYVEECKRNGIKPYSKTVFQELIAEQKRKRNPLEYKSAVDVFFIKDAFVDEHGNKRAVILAMMRTTGFVIGTVSKGKETREWIHALIRLIHQMGGFPDECAFVGHLPKAIKEQTVDCLQYYGSSVVVESRNGDLIDIGHKILKEMNLTTMDTAFEAISIMNAACAEHNEQCISGSSILSRKHAHAIECTVLNEMPKNDYDLTEYTVASVQYYHVRVEGMYYSVPFEYRNEKMTVYISDKYVELNVGGITVYIHDKLSGTPGKYSTDRDHVPNEEAIPWGEVSGRSLRIWAEKIGPYTLNTINYLLRVRTYEVQAFRICDTILHMSSKYGYEALESACKDAWDNKAVSYGFISERLKTGTK